MTVRLLLCGSVLLAFAAAPASANGYGEDAPYQFRSANERQVLLNQEQLRLQFKNQNQGVGSQYGLGTAQTANDLTISIDGNGNNTINVDQDNQGNQSAQHTEGSSRSAAFGACSQMLNC